MKAVSRLHEYQLAQGDEASTMQAQGDEEVGTQIEANGEPEQTSHWST